MPFDSVCHRSLKIINEHCNIYPTVDGRLDWVGLMAFGLVFSIFIQLSCHALIISFLSTTSTWKLLSTMGTGPILFGTCIATLQFAGNLGNLNIER